VSADEERQERERVGWSNSSLFLLFFSSKSKLSKKLNQAIDMAGTGFGLK
jgi:hypothetical protein